MGAGVLHCCTVDVLFICRARRITASQPHETFMNIIPIFMLAGPLCGTSLPLLLFILPYQASQPPNQPTSQRGCFQAPSPNLWLMQANVVERDEGS